MTNASRIVILLIMTAFLGVGAARGQELSPPDAGDAMGPSDLSLPDEAIGPMAPEALPPGGPEQSGEGSEGGDSSVLTGERPMSVDELEGCDNYAAGPQDMWDEYSAPIESTGSWLRRGFWYAQAEAVVWNRFWNRDDKFLAAQDPQVLNPDFFPKGRNPAGIQPNFTTNRLLMLNGSQPGQDTAVRVTLGNFLFRDSRNRDHLAEFTVLGGGTWHQHRELASSSPHGLFVPFYIGGEALVNGQLIGNRTFNQSTQQDADYSNEIRSFEANYRVRSRMRRDQLVMDANGEWHRGANAGFTREYLAGLRIMEIRDIFNWTAQDIINVGDDGSYLIRTDNDLFGLQLGAGTEYETSRWSLGANTKMGFYVNDALSRRTLNFTADDTDDSDLTSQSNEMSWIVDVQVTGRWHLTPNISLRASYDLMYITEVALGPTQANFITDLAYVNTSGDPLYHGMSFGFEGYW